MLVVAVIGHVLTDYLPLDFVSLLLNVFITSYLVDLLLYAFLSLQSALSVVSWLYYRVRPAVLNLWEHALVVGLLV